MIQIGDKIVSTELFDNYFVCHLEKCRGMCCVYGDSGAPLTEEETKILEEQFDMISPFLRPEGVDAILSKGAWEFDADGDRVTPLMGHDDCAYSVIDNGIARCGIENAFQSGKIDFQKPLSCHLYPVRISRIGNNIALNYHKWDVCKPALSLGREYDLPVFRFLKEAIARAFGNEFYEELEKTYIVYKKNLQ
ncbi:MAG: DUF3109 family protein [Bacteroidales bacterium]|nr:DUF3109 family protein [Bacteroidales bacterium]